MKRAVGVVLLLVVWFTVKVANAGFVLSEPAYIWLDDGIPLIGGGPSISADGLSLFFYGDYTGSGFEDIFPGYGGRDLYVVTRPAIYSNTWTVQNLGATVNSAAHEEAPDISADGLTLYFFSNRSGGSGSRDLWVTTRPTTYATWGPPVNLGSTVNSSAHDGYPSISSDGCSLYFTSERSGGLKLWVTTRPNIDACWGEPVSLATVNYPSPSVVDWSPNISVDGLMLFFSSDRPGGYGGSWGDTWVTTRPTTDADWGEPMNLGPVVNSSSDDTEPDISADGSALYFGAYRNPMWYIFEVSISLEVDLNGDTRINFKDFATLGRSWGQNNPLADLSPAPIGDGIVDDQDMAVFAEHWLLSTLPPDCATEPDPPDGSPVAPLISDSNVYMVLDYTPGQRAVKHTGYFSEYIEDVNDHVEDANLGSPPWPVASTTAFIVGYDHPDIPAFARAPLVRAKTYYWCVDEFDGETTYPGETWSFFVMPIEVWDPYPADGETEVPADPTLILRWNLGDAQKEDYGITYDVYYSTDKSEAETSTTPLANVETTSYALNDLDPETMYYWRIDTRRGLMRPPFTVDIITGDLWTFTTASSGDN